MSFISIFNSLIILLLILSYISCYILIFDEKCKNNHQKLYLYIDVNFTYLSNLNIGIITFDEKTNHKTLLEKIKFFKKIDSCLRKIMDDADFPFDLSFSSSKGDEIQVDGVYLPEDYKKIWHLKRINERSPSFNFTQTSSFFKRHINPSENPFSLPSHVLIFDTGIDITHKSLENKLGEEEYHHSFVGYENDMFCEFENQAFCDSKDHGTHVAGLVASDESGYNPYTKIYSYKVIGKFQTLNSKILLNAINKAIDFKKKHANDVVIASMSIKLNPQEDSEEKIQILDKALEDLFNAGVFIVSSAGNLRTNACKYFPSKSKWAFTVGSIDIEDSVTSSSNFGKCVNIWSPGEYVYSTSMNNRFEYKFGTSMATPLVSGYASAVGSYYQITDPNKIKNEILQRSRPLINQKEDDIYGIFEYNNNVLYDGKDI